MSMPAPFPSLAELDRLETLETARLHVQRMLFHELWLPAYLGNAYPSYANMQQGYLETLFPNIFMWGPEYDHARKTMKRLSKALTRNFSADLFYTIKHLSDTMGKAWSDYYLDPKNDLEGLDEHMPLTYINLEVRGALPEGGANSDKLPGCKKLNHVLFSFVHWKLTERGLDYNRIAYNVALACIGYDLFLTEPAFQPVAVELDQLRTQLANTHAS